MVDLRQEETMDEDDVPDEGAATLEGEMIDAARQLIEEHDYSREDIEGILKGTVFGAV